jgi:hypothetical protein
MFSIVGALLVTISFGKATPTFFDQVLLSAQTTDDTMIAALRDFVEVWKGPAIGCLMASLGSSILCGVQAKQKNRNPIIWTIKGLLGGPFTVRSLQDCGPLRTKAEEKEQNFLG